MSATPAEHPIVDTHQHFWDLGRNRYPWLEEMPPIPFRYGDYSGLRRSYLPPDYRRDVGDVPVVRTVHVEAEWERHDPVAETRWLETVAERSGLPSACIAHAALDADDAPDILAKHAGSPLVRGIRHKPAAAPSAADARRGGTGSMDDPRWRRGYAAMGPLGFSFDLQTPWWHFDAAADLARDFRSTQIIVNHTGLPADRSNEGLAGWRRAMAMLAEQPNVALKISGLGEPDHAWTPERNVPVIREAIAIFGADRCMFASNYPVDSLVAPFAAIVAGFRSAIANRTAEEQRALLHDNAVRIYRL